MRRPNLSFATIAAIAIVLAGCTSSSDVLAPAALAPAEGEQQDAASDPLPPVMPPEQAATEEPAPVIGAISADTRVQFAPVVGAPAENAAVLAARLAESAGARGIALAAAGDAETTHIMKGYFSAISESGRTTVIYVWDLLDPSGNRIHRFQGRLSDEDGEGVGWAAVGPETMNAIADRSVDQLAAWLSSTPG